MSFYLSQWLFTLLSELFRVTSGESEHSHFARLVRFQPSELAFLSNGFPGLEVSHSKYGPLSRHLLKPPHMPSWWAWLAGLISNFPSFLLSAPVRDQKLQPVLRLAGTIVFFLRPKNSFSFTWRNLRWFPPSKRPIPYCSFSTLLKPFASPSLF